MEVQTTPVHIFQFNSSWLVSVFDILMFYHLQPNQETVTTPDLSSLSSPLIDTERNLGLLLGLHASYLAKSTPLSPMEIECASEFIILKPPGLKIEICASHILIGFTCVSLCTEWLQSSIFSGGLQTSQIHYNYNEEKDEDHCSSLGTTTPDKAKLYSRRITLSDHAQPFLQAIADNNTQDHTVKVQSWQQWLKLHRSHEPEGCSHAFMSCLYHHIIGLPVPNRALL